MTGSLEQLTRARLSAPQLSPAQPLRQHLPALLVFAAGLLITYEVEQQQLQGAAREATAKFEARAAEISTQLAVALRSPVQTLHSLAGVLQVFPQLEPAEFSRYAQQLGYDDSAIAGVHWLPRVTQAQRLPLERQLGVSLSERRGVRWEVAESREIYLPIAAVAPWEDSAWLGRDRLGLFGDNALGKALQTGQVVASLITPEPGKPALISLSERVCATEHGAPDCPAESQLGLAELWIRVEPILEERAADIADDGIYVSLYDLSAAQGEHLLYTSAPKLAAQPLSAVFGRGVGVDIQLADRWLRAVFSQQPAEVRHLDTALTLVSGTSISALLALLLAAGRSLRALRVRLAAARQLGPYTLEDELGAGSMGTVYRAQHRLLRRPTAVKLLEPDQVDTASLARFEREVQQTAMLCHPNTIAVYDYGRTSDGIFYYAMEYLDGVSLQRLVERTGRQPPGRVLWILLQAAGALAEAHAAGLIHRDIKPANLMLCVRGGVYDFLKVLDFGLVRNLSDPRVLEKNVFVGTPLYAAPEAYLHPDTVDERSDVYSLGATAFFLLTGREPFHGQRVVDVLEQHVSAAPPSFSELGVHDIPSELQRLVRSCLAKEPTRRPQSAAELRAQIEPMRAQLPWTEQDARDLWQKQRQRLQNVAPPGPQAKERLGAANEDIALGATIAGPLSEG